MIYEELVSRARSLKNKSEEDARKLEYLERAEVIHADNVAHMYFVDNPKTEWDWRTDFPNIAPPFEHFFIEWNMPLKINEHGVITVRQDMRNIIVGVLFVTHDSKLVPEFHSAGVKWITQAYCFIKKAGRDAVLVGANQLAIMPDGTLWRDRRGDLFFYDRTANIPAEHAQMVSGMNIGASLLAISFMHCKNVELKTVLPSYPISRKFQRKHGIPLVKYKVLEIEPMKKVLRTEGQSETFGLKHALHICRGHFKDYSKGGGLFGKYKGLYWWESHVRGDPSQGVVVKDYNVNAPKKQ